MVKRREIQVLRRAGHGQVETAALAGVGRGVSLDRERTAACVTTSHSCKRERPPRTDTLRRQRRATR